MWALKYPGPVVAGTGGCKTRYPGGRRQYLPPVRPTISNLPAVQGCECRGKHLIDRAGLPPRTAGLGWVLGGVTEVYTVAGSNPDFGRDKQ